LHRRDQSRVPLFGLGVVQAVGVIVRDLVIQVILSDIVDYFTLDDAGRSQIGHAAVHREALRIELHY